MTSRNTVVAKALNAVRNSVEVEVSLMYAGRVQHAMRDAVRYVSGVRMTSTNTLFCPDEEKADEVVDILEQAGVPKSEIWTNAKNTLARNSAGKALNADVPVGTVVKIIGRSILFGGERGQIVGRAGSKYKVKLIDRQGKPVVELLPYQVGAKNAVVTNDWKSYETAADIIKHATQDAAELEAMVKKATPWRTEMARMRQRADKLNDAYYAISSVDKGDQLYGKAMDAVKRLQRARAAAGDLWYSV